MAFKEGAVTIFTLDKYITEHYWDKVEKIVENIKIN